MSRRPRDEARELLEEELYQLRETVIFGGPDEPLGTPNLLADVQQNALERIFFLFDESLAREEAERARAKALEAMRRVDLNDAQRRLPPKGTPEREAHEHLLSARRYGVKALEAMRRVDLNDAQREMLREVCREVAVALRGIEEYLRTGEAS